MPQLTPLTYRSTKTYTHSVGLSCAFRQYKATSHCRFLHGYALQVQIVFEGPLDDRNWVQDFGNLKGLKEYLTNTFDHKTLIARDDPYLEQFRWLHTNGVIDLVELNAVGMEKFAEMIFRYVETVVLLQPESRKDIWVHSVRIWEHEGNSAEVVRAPFQITDIDGDD